MSLLGHYAWYLGNSDDRPGPVATKLPNDFGLHDTLGNVWEWTQPVHRMLDKSDFEEANLTSAFSTTPASNGLFHPIVRGGSFWFHGPFIRSAKPYSSPADRTDWTFGFRVVRMLPESR